MGFKKDIIQSGNRIKELEGNNKAVTNGAKELRITIESLTK